MNLPKNTKVCRWKSGEAQLTVKARTLIEKEERAPGFHASDLLSLKMAYWRIVKPLAVSDREVPIFLIGRILHSIIIESVDPELKNQTDSGSKYSEELGIIYSPDLLSQGQPIEIKTTRSFYPPKEGQELTELNDYIEQLMIYMAAENSLVGRLLILYLNAKDINTGRTSPEFRAYTVTVTQEELDNYKKEIIEKVALLSNAVETKLPETLPHCADWKCGLNCKWWDDCKPEDRYGKVYNSRKKTWETPKPNEQDIS